MEHKSTRRSASRFCVLSRSQGHPESRIEPPRIREKRVKVTRQHSRRIKAVWNRSTIVGYFRRMDERRDAADPRNSFHFVIYKIRKKKYILYTNNILRSWCWKVFEQRSPLSSAEENDQIHALTFCNDEDRGWSTSSTTSSIDRPSYLAKKLRLSERSIDIDLGSLNVPVNAFHPFVSRGHQKFYSDFLGCEINRFKYSTARNS